MFETHYIGLSFTFGSVVAFFLLIALAQVIYYRNYDNVNSLGLRIFPLQRFIFLTNNAEGSRYDAILQLNNLLIVQTWIMSQKHCCFFIIFYT